MIFTSSEYPDSGCLFGRCTHDAVAKGFGFPNNKQIDFNLNRKQ